MQETVKREGRDKRHNARDVVSSVCENKQVITWGELRTRVLVTAKRWMQVSCSRW